MGIIVNKTDDNTELSKRINADLRARAQSAREADDPDLVEDTDYTKDLQKTSKFGWIWIVLVILAILALIFIIFI